MTHQEFVNKIGSESAKKLYALYDLACENGLKVKVRTFANVCGDFCIFIYDKKVKSSYMVGFDGNFGDGKLTIDYCIGQAVEWINEYVAKK
jgi:hypothetical protein